MAIDSNPPLGATSNLETPVIENEIPAYRAISARAVASLILGLASVFCFTSLWFLLVTAASILFGWAALRGIRRLPDILTGAGLAKAGIGLGALFGLSAVTQVVVSDLVLSYDATQFAKMYVEVLKKQSIPEAIYFLQPPDYRKERTPDQLLDELKKATSPTMGNVYNTLTAEIRGIHDRIKGPNQEIHFAKLETKLADGLTKYANALVDIDGPATKDHPETEQFALIELMKAPGGGLSDWKVRSIKYPYKPASVALFAEKKDDGHGHSH